MMQKLKSLLFLSAFALGFNLQAFPQKGKSVIEHPVRYPNKELVKPHPYDPKTYPRRPETIEYIKEQYNTYFETFREEITSKTTTNTSETVLCFRQLSVDGVLLCKTNNTFFSDWDFTRPDFDYKNSQHSINKTELYENASVYIDFSVQASESNLNLLSKFKNIKCVLLDGNMANVKMENGKIYYDKDGACLERKGFAEYFIIDQLWNKSVNGKENTIVSFVNNDNKTHTDLVAAFGTKLKRFEKNNFKEFENFLQANQNNNIYILGHIENEKFVSYNLDNVKQFEIDIVTINELVKKYKLCLQTLGCNSINNKSNIGYSSPVNSIDLINAVQNAIKATTYGSMIQGLTIPGKATCFIDWAYFDNLNVFDFKITQLFIDAEGGKITVQPPINRVIVHGQIPVIRYQSEDYGPGPLDALIVILEIAGIFFIIFYFPTKISDFRFKKNNDEYKS